MRLSSSKSTILSLIGIKEAKAGLSTRRLNILKKVPAENDWARFELDSIEIDDLAYLSAATGDEFSLLRGKHDDIVFHGGKLHCHFTGILYDMILEHKLTLVAHSHPGEEYPCASQDDIDLLRKIGQSSSIIISGRTGVSIVYRKEGV